MSAPDIDLRNRPEEWAMIQKVKRQVITRLKRKLRPHMWKSGYGHTEQGKWVALEIWCFPQRRRRGEDRTIPRTMSEYFQCLQGFYPDGLIDAAGGGCALITYESLPVEDLFRLELWLSKNLAGELAEQARIVKEMKRTDKAA